MVRRLRKQEQRLAEQQQQWRAGQWRPGGDAAAERGGGGGGGGAHASLALMDEEVRSRYLLHLAPCPASLSSR